MTKPLSKIKTVLVPIEAGAAGQTALAIGRALAEEVVLVGVVPVAPGESISVGAQAARLIRRRPPARGRATSRPSSSPRPPGRSCRP